MARYGQTQAQSATGGTDGNYSVSQGDATAVRLADTTITFTGPVITSNQIKKITIDTGVHVSIYENGRGKVRITISGTTITLAGCGTAPVPSTTLTIDVEWVGQKKSYDSGVAADRVFQVNDLAGRRVTTPVALIAAPQNYTLNTWADLGPEISVDGFTRISLWINHVNTNNTGTYYRALAKHTSGGTEEYDFPMVLASSPFTGSAQGPTAKLDTDTDQKFVLTYNVLNTVPFVQFQCKAITTGSTAGNVATAFVTYGWGQ
jgi:hypothetical protein